jgi:DNA-binding transcriptional ArsR family regulator
MDSPNMSEEPDIARIASLLGDPSRASICLALMDGRPLAAGELALRASISAQTASNHLAKLMGEGLVTVESLGRHRFYRLAKPDIAHAIEALAAVAPARRRGLSPAASKAEAFRFARTHPAPPADQPGI